MAVNGVSSDRNYANEINGTTANKVYNAVFTDKEDDGISVTDFFNMMVTQLTNQDFMNPIDDTQYLAQMAQFSTMQEMMDLCKYSKQNYVMSMIGKEVTVSKTSVGGAVSNITGKVEKITLTGDDYLVYVDGKPYDISKITQIAEASAGSKSETGTESSI